MPRFRNDELLHLIINSFPGLLAYIDKEERYRFVNNAYKEWFGEDYTGKLLKDVVKEIRADRYEYIKRVLAGEKVSFKASTPHRSKGVVWTELTYTPHVNKEGEVEGFIVMATDITEQKNIEDLLKNEREQLYALFMQAPISICLFMGPDLKVELINELARKSINGSDITGMKLVDALPKLVSVGLVKEIDEVYRTGKTKIIPNWKMSLLEEDGKIRERIYELHYRPWRNLEGQIIGVFHMGIDVTEQLAARRSAEESELKFRSYAESMPQMAFIADASGNITYYNQRWFDYTGFPSDDSYGWNWRPVHHPDDLKRTIETWTESLKTGKLYEIEYRLRRHDGVYHWHLGRAVPVKDESGQITAWVGTNTDIHDQKEASSNLEKALQTRDEFLSMASHELKTPITSLKLQSQILSRSLARGDEKGYSKEKLETNTRQTNELVDRLSRLIDDMLDVSRIRTGKLRLEKSETDLEEVFRDVLSRMEEQFHEAGIKVPEIKSTGKVIGFWDRFRIEQVILNLLTNAIKYGRQLPVEIQIEQRGNKARFAVIDLGHGIAENDLERIFDRFERAINASEVSGLGLGLFITKQLVEAHQGKIWAESELGKGAKFVVELDLKPSESKDESHNES